MNRSRWKDDCTVIIIKEVGNLLREKGKSSHPPHHTRGGIRSKVQSANRVKRNDMKHHNID